MALEQLKLMVMQAGLGMPPDEIKNYYNFYLSKLTKVPSFVNSGKKFYNNKKIIDIFNTIYDAKNLVERYILSNGVYITERVRNIQQKNNGAYIFNIIPRCRHIG
jgi:hypothetical protein